MLTLHRLVHQKVSVVYTELSSIQRAPYQRFHRIYTQQNVIPLRLEKCHDQYNFGG